MANLNILYGVMHLQAGQLRSLSTNGYTMILARYFQDDAHNPLLINIRTVFVLGATHAYIFIISVRSSQQLTAQRECIGWVFSSMLPHSVSTLLQNIIMCMQCLVA